MGFFSSLWGKNENGKNTQNNTPTVQQPRMTEAQRHDAFVQSLRENTANGKYGPVPHPEHCTQSRGRLLRGRPAGTAGMTRVPPARRAASGLGLAPPSRCRPLRAAVRAGAPGWVRAAAAAAEDMGPAATAATAAAGMAVIAAATAMAGAETFCVFSTAAAQPAGLSVV